MLMLATTLNLAYILETCTCIPTFNTAYGVRGQKYGVYWEKPCLACNFARNVREEVSSTRRPAALSIGQHNISYKFIYLKSPWDGSEEIECYAIINVQGMRDCHVCLQ